LRLEESYSRCYTKKHYPNGSSHPSPVKTWTQIPIRDDSPKALNAPICFVLSAFSFGASLFILGILLAGLPLVPVVSKPLQIPDSCSSFTSSSKCTYPLRAFSIFYWWISSPIGRAPCWAAVVSPFGLLRVSIYWSPYSFNAPICFVLSAFPVWSPLILDTLPGLVEPTLSIHTQCDLFFEVFLTAFNAPICFVLSAFSVWLTLILGALLSGSFTFALAPFHSQPTRIHLGLVALTAICTISRFALSAFLFGLPSLVLVGRLWKDTEKDWSGFVTGEGS